MSDVYKTSTETGAPSRERVIEHNRASRNWNKGIIKYIQGEAGDKRWTRLTTVKKAWLKRDQDPEAYKTAVEGALCCGITHIWVYKERREVALNDGVDQSRQGQEQFNLMTGE
jgi:hypothetical protein